jgi:hypothetical protein
VIEDEWFLMERGQASPRAWALVDEMRSTIHSIEPASSTDQVLYDKGLDRVHDLVDQRRLRLLEAGPGMPHVLWSVLAVGGIIVVSFTYLFGLENTWSHRLRIAALASIIALVLFTIYALDRPFAGITRVQPDAFELVLERIEQAPGR